MSSFVSFIPIIIFLTKGLSSLIPSLKEALIEQNIFNNTIFGILLSFLGSSHGQKQLDNVSELFFSSATLGTYEVCLVSLLDCRLYIRTKLFSLERCSSTVSLGFLSFSNCVFFVVCWRLVKQCAQCVPRLWRPQT